MVAFNPQFLIPYVHGKDTRLFYSYKNQATAGYG